MELQELHSYSEHAHAKGQKGIGFTTAIVAVLLAIATMLANRTHVEGGKLEARIEDLWTSYNGKHSLTHTFTADMQQAELNGRIGAILARHTNMKGEEKEKAVQEIMRTAQQQASQFRTNGENEDKESEAVKSEALEMENEVEALSHSGDIYNVSELFLQVSIVLCSIALLAESRLLWRISFLGTLAGVGLVLYGLLRH